jgi:serine protease
MRPRRRLSQTVAMWLIVLPLLALVVTHGQVPQPDPTRRQPPIAQGSDTGQAPPTSGAADVPQIRALGNPTHAANIVRAAMDGLDWVAGEVIVKFRDELPGFAAEQLASRVLARERPTRFTPLGDAVLIDLQNMTDVQSVVSVLRAQPEVEYAEPNYIHHVKSKPNDPQYSAQWNLSMLGMETAWDIAQGGSANVIVAVIDTGLAFLDVSYQFRYWNGHSFSLVTVPFAAADDLITPGRVVKPYDFYWDDTSPVDMDKHGTHVAGTIGQLTNNGKGEAGIAYSVKLMPLKACYSFWDLQFWSGAQGTPGWASTTQGGCPVSDEVLALRYAADNGAKVINMSLGGPQPSSVLQGALTYAVQHGAFVAIAAGNDRDQGSPPSYPAAYARDIDGVVAVAAVDRNSRRAWYSTSGSYVEVAAPGGDTRADSSGGILQQTLNDYYFDYPPSLLFVPRFNVFTDESLQGTSMATPHVSGLAALLASRGITSPGVIEAILKRFARDLGTVGRDDEYGYGLIDARATLRGLGVAR